MGKHSKAYKAKAREENKLPTVPLNEISTVSPSPKVSAANYDSIGSSFPMIPTSDISKLNAVESNEMAIASGQIDGMAKDENGTNGEAMEREGPPCSSNKLVKQGGGGVPKVVEFQSSQRRRVEGSNPIPNNKGGSAAQFQGDGHPDSRTAGGKIRVAGGDRHQASTSRVGDFKRIDALGRQLSSILRHRAVKLGLNMRSDGYVLVNDLLNLRLKTQAGLPLSSHTVYDIQEAVKRDNKQRFGLQEETGQLLIRANQGHSIQTVKSEDLLRPILSPEEVPVCIHGTYLKYLNSIQKQGLKRMKRLHIHFATGLFKEKSVISGMRSSCEVLIHLNVQKYLKDGMKLYCSENGVILAEGNNGVIPPDYFAKIERVNH